MEKNERYRNWSIQKKLLISHGIIIGLAVLLVIILLGGMVSIKGNIDKIYMGPLTNIDRIGNVRYGLTDLQRAINRLLIEGEDAVEEAYPTFEKTVEQDAELVKESMSVLEQHLTKDESKEKLQELSGKVDEGEEIRPQLMELLKDGNFEEAYDLNYNTYLPIVNEIKAIAEELEAVIQETAASYYSSANASSLFLVCSGIALLVFSVAMGIYITLRMTKSIVAPIQQITEASKLMYSGDMSAGRMISYQSKDEIGILADSLRGTMKNLGDYIQEISEILGEMAQGNLTSDGSAITDYLGDFASIKESFVYILKRFNSTLSDIQSASDQVDSSSTEIASAARALSEGTTDQSSALEELTATVTNVAAMAEESAKKTQQAYDSVKLSTEKAEEERKKMEDLTEEMRRITEISKEIENIIGAIEDIASQTNLLSLNASIEAARAGEAGRGFAVVADQIGKLASDSAQSAVTTRELIVKTLEEIEKGNAITESTSVAFEKVINDLNEYAEVARDTNETAKSQAAALEEIEGGIDQISTVVESTASASEESATISEHLSNKAAELDGLVKRFKLF